ncbi:hypothetical protein COLO4_08546 [Corchorus olitorius]|uniref:Uncharacterized protein n=1 Tax=Corchorus olitorius TaxID=93759 RepID=A0A1R3KFE7_9ROSI|nr:hypothetical protein COLO4_08546 [Corchorus olitorius]
MVAVCRRLTAIDDDNGGYHGWENETSPPAQVTEGMPTMTNMIAPSKPPTPASPTKTALGTQETQSMENETAPPAQGTEGMVSFLHLFPLCVFYQKMGVNSTAVVFFFFFLHQPTMTSMMAPSRPPTPASPTEIARGTQETQLMVSFLHLLHLCFTRERV